MAKILGRPPGECTGSYLADLLPGDQRIEAERLLDRAAAGDRLATAVLIFPGRVAAVACLFEARRLRRGVDGEPVVRLSSLSSQNDLAKLLIPFQMAAEAGGVALWMYSSPDRLLKWIGGDAGMTPFSERTLSLSQVVRKVHPEDREALRRLMRPPSAVRSPPVELRFFGRDDEWHNLACQTRRVELGYGGPTVVFGTVRDETETRKLVDVAEESLRRARDQQLRVELAIELQKSMLPRISSGLAGLDVDCRYRPCQDGLDVGGDWYGAFGLPDGAVAVNIGDVQGHDAAAAALMGQICAVLRAIAEHEPAPGTVLERVNELLIKTDASRFASCTMLHMDSRSGHVTGTTAGHVPVLYVHNDGTFEVLALSGGPVLGIVSDADYPEESFVLDRDSALVMVTDGVVEGPELTLEAGLRHTGRQAAEALRQGLSSTAIAHRVLETAKTASHLDDAAVLVLRRP
jgi:serine phosphatase RsbU (regulator of sigma subunit)/PAS domain-containing protein